jgi:F-type H+-transporting ATPase subunit delta
MAIQGVARRYAEAVFDLASTPEAQESWLNALGRLAQIVMDEETRAYFENPAISDEAKHAALERILPGDENAEARNLARILIRRQRFDQLPNILEVFEEMVLRSRGIAVADVTTAVPLTNQEQQFVRDALRRITGSEVQLRSRVDESIIGGVIARIGDRLIDGSVRTQLRELRASLGRA